MNNQWLLLYDPATQRNVAIFVHNPEKGDFHYFTRNNELKEAFDIVSKDTFTTVKRTANKKLIMYQPVQITKNHPDYMLHFVNTFLGNYQVGNKGLSYRSAEETMNYFANYLSKRN